MKMCITCNGEGWMMGPGHDGEPCAVCWPPELHNAQTGGSGWLRDDGTAMPLEEVQELGRIASPRDFAAP